MVSMVTRRIVACPIMTARALEFALHSAGAAANHCVVRRSSTSRAKSTRTSKRCSIGWKKVKRNARLIMIARAPACATWTTTSCARERINFACEIEEAVTGKQHVIII